MVRVFIYVIFCIACLIKHQILYRKSYSKQLYLKPFYQDSLYKFTRISGKIYKIYESINLKNELGTVDFYKNGGSDFAFIFLIDAQNLYLLKLRSP